MCYEHHKNYWITLKGEILKIKHLQISAAGVDITLKGDSI